ncbi:hypothetical protein J6590_090369 [Homalodisca vitripennis]|nr:hypothetical protein J6590_090369 [Homalodisca vitripennis]
MVAGRCEDASDSSDTWSLLVKGSGTDELLMSAVLSRCVQCFIEIFKQSELVLPLLNVKYKSAHVNVRCKGCTPLSTLRHPPSAEPLISPALSPAHATAPLTQNTQWCF